jgi:hypothetical protein
MFSSLNMKNGLMSSPPSVQSAATRRQWRWAHSLVGTAWRKKDQIRRFEAFDPLHTMMGTVVPALESRVDGKREPIWLTLDTAKRWLAGATRVEVTNGPT